MASHGAVRQAVSEEVRNLDPRLGLVLLTCRLMPNLVGIRLRAVGLWLGRNTWLNASCHLDATDTIEVGDEVGLGQVVLVLTLTHHMGPSLRRLGNARPAPGAHRRRDVGGRAGGHPAQCHDGVGDRRGPRRHPIV